MKNYVCFFIFIFLSSCLISSLSLCNSFFFNHKIAFFSDDLLNMTKFDEYSKNIGFFFFFFFLSFSFHLIFPHLLSHLPLPLLLFLFLLLSNSISHRRKQRYSKNNIIKLYRKCGMCVMCFVVCCYSCCSFSFIDFSTFLRSICVWGRQM